MALYVTVHRAGRTTMRIAYLWGYAQGDIVKVWRLSP